jgi:hypothetical protein
LRVARFRRHRGGTSRNWRRPHRRGPATRVFLPRAERPESLLADAAAGAGDPRPPDDARHAHHRTRRVLSAGDPARYLRVPRERARGRRRGARADQGRHHPRAHPPDKVRRLREGREYRGDSGQCGRRGTLLRLLRDPRPERDPADREAGEGGQAGAAQARGLRPTEEKVVSGTRPPTWIARGLPSYCTFSSLPPFRRPTAAGPRAFREPAWAVPAVKLRALHSTGASMRPIQTPCLRPAFWSPRCSGSR